MPTTAAPTTTTSVEVVPETALETGQPTDAPSDLVAAEALVEEVSIDGMCGVY